MEAYGHLVKKTLYWARRGLQRENRETKKGIFFSTLLVETTRRDLSKLTNNQEIIKVGKRTME